jgi:transposase-like protein
MNRIPQNRPLYPVVFFDTRRVKIRDEGLVKNKAVYVALALNPDGSHPLSSREFYSDWPRSATAHPGHF